MPLKIMIKKSIGLLLAIILLFSNNNFSQQLEFGLGGGVSHFKGDVSPNFNPLQLGVGGNALFRYNLTRSVSFRGQIMFATYNASDINTTDVFYNNRGAVIKGNILEGSALIEYNFLNQTTKTKRKDWTPYLFGGIGYAMAKNKSDQFAQPISINTPVLPYGIGIKYRFKGPFSACVEFGTRYTLSDELDLSFGKYFGNSNVTNGSTVLNDKITFGNLSRNDQYYYTSITITYTIFDLICPD
jgi:Domain of unknown function (DUF6089)